MKEFICRVPDGFISWSDEALISYLFIQAICSATYVNEIPISIDSLLIMMYGEEPGRKTKQQIINGVNELLANNIINGRQHSSSIYIIECGINVNSNKFATVSLTDVISILRSDGYKKNSEIKYLTLLMMSRNSRLKGGRISNMPIKYFANELGVSNRTIIRYNESLTQLNIIYIGKAFGWDITKGGEIYTIPNAYGRYIDRDYVDAYVDERDYKTYKLMIKKKSLTNGEKEAISEYVKVHNKLQMKYAAEIKNYIPSLLDEFKP